MHYTQNDARIKALVSTYVKEPQFGMVIGAGVSVDSFVPTYDELALRLLEEASKETGFRAEWVQAFVENQRELVKQGSRAVPPDEIVLFVRSLLDGNEELLRDLSRKTLWRGVSAKRIVARSAFENNTTLNAVLTFCAARPGSVLSPASKYAIETNAKVGAILTTNYDNLLEGAFHTKYRRNLLKPVGRPSSTEFEGGRRLIPVYHIHGYLGYREEAYHGSEQKYPEVVIAEDDYFRVFYDPLGFANYIAMSFLRRFPCLFVGSAMTDKNLRRYLFHLAQNVESLAPHQRKFAILKNRGNQEDEVTDRVLYSYGVEAIWIKDFCEIENILRRMYTAVPDVAKDDWDYLSGYRWNRPANASP